jgi:pseudouridylate synthase
MKNHLLMDPSVSAAILDGKPVVALESTIISHGMPYPQNVETALLVEQKVRENGAIPATIAVINGKMKAGLSIDEIEILGKEALKIQKVSRRDLPMILARGENGATTVASTMIIAAYAGIKIFATGGIGGVHRGAGATFDISADLQELAHTNVAVVCAGAKSILDIGLTLEYLETHGVPVVGFQTPDFPAFFTRKSGFPVDFNAPSEKELAAMLRIKWAIEPLSGGVIAITPFLLAEIERRTEGASLRTNIQLILNNAALAGRLAAAFFNG